MDEGADAREAIRSLFELYANDVYRYARFMLGDSSEARDVVQEVFLRVIRSWSGFRHQASAKTWLMSITRNYVSDRLRKRRVERMFFGRYRSSETVSWSEVVDSMMALEAALLQLKDTYRQVFILRHVENFSVQETAKILGWSESKVTTTDHRAIAQLRKILIRGDTNEDGRRENS